MSNETIELMVMVIFFYIFSLLCAIFGLIHLIQIFAAIKDKKFIRYFNTLFPENMTSIRKRPFILYYSITTGLSLTSNIVSMVFLQRFFFQEDDTLYVALLACLCIFVDMLYCFFYMMFSRFGVLYKDGFLIHEIPFVTKRYTFDDVKYIDISSTKTFIAFKGLTRVICDDITYDSSNKRYISVSMEEDLERIPELRNKITGYKDSSTYKHMRQNTPKDCEDIESSSEDEFFKQDDSSIDKNQNHRKKK